MSRCSPEATTRAALTASLFLVAHELPVGRTPSTKAAWADLTLVLVRSMNLGRSHFDVLHAGYWYSRLHANRNGASVDESGSLAVGDTGSNEFGDLVDAVRLMGVDAVGQCLCCWQPTALSAEPPQRNSSCTAIPCAIASNGSEKLTGLDLQKSPGPEPALAGHPVESDQAASGPIGRSGPPKKMNGA
jgi:hypothetical protein